MHSNPTVKTGVEKKTEADGMLGADARKANPIRQDCIIVRQVFDKLTVCVQLHVLASLNMKLLVSVIY